MGRINEDENEDTGETRQRGWGFGEGHGFMGHRAFMRSQFGQRGWLRPAILRLLQDKPMNGMEIINRFNEASHGWWKPSPGSIYPLLETLENEEMIKKRSDGRYEVTKKFASEFGPIGQVDEMLTNMEGSVSYFEDMAKSDKAKFSSYKKRIERLSDRLSKIK
jgi:DNA-binding PadR family transcriptional regulator